MHLERHVARAHGEELGTTEGPVCCSVGAFHLQHAPGVDGRSNLSCQVLPDHDDLRARINDTCFSDFVADPDVDLAQGKRVGRLTHAGGVCTYVDSTQGSGLLKAAGLDAAGTQLLDQILPNCWTGCYDVSGGGLA